MRNSSNIKINWENDLWESVAERDVLKLRNQLKKIQSSPELIINELIKNAYKGKNDLS